MKNKRNTANKKLGERWSYEAAHELEALLLGIEKALTEQADALRVSLNTERTRATNLSVEIVDLHKQLAALREVGPCGLHLKARWVDSYPAIEGGSARQIVVNGYCLDCASERATSPCGHLRARIPKLIIERLPDLSYGAFLDETSSSCIAVGITEEEAREAGERRACLDCAHERAVVAATLSGHRPSIQRDYTLKCSCGWQSSMVSSRPAVLDWSDHVITSDQQQALRDHERAAIAAARLDEYEWLEKWFSRKPTEVTGLTYSLWRKELHDHRAERAVIRNNNNDEAWVKALGFLTGPNPRDGHEEESDYEQTMVRDSPAIDTAIQAFAEKVISGVNAMATDIHEENADADDVVAMIQSLINENEPCDYVAGKGRCSKHRGHKGLCN